MSLGPVKMTVTQINAGKQHNAIPAAVELVVDVRVNDQYSNKEIVEILQKDAPCDSIIPRSLRLNSSSIPVDHPLSSSRNCVRTRHLWVANTFRSIGFELPVSKIRARR